MSTRSTKGRTQAHLSAVPASTAIGPSRDNTEGDSPAGLAQITAAGLDLGRRLRPMKPNRGDTYRGIYIPAWLLGLGLSAEALVTWGAMARLAGRGRRLRGSSYARIGSVAGLTPSETRQAVKSLEDAGVVSRFDSPGRPSEYAFRAPVPGDTTWAKHVHLVDAGTDDPWRPW